jgi:hypothetical protein
VIAESLKDSRVRYSIADLCVVVQSDEEEGGVGACDQEVDADMVQYLQDAGRWMGEEEVKEEDGDDRGGEKRCGGRGVCCREEDDNVD